MGLNFLINGGVKMVGKFMQQKARLASSVKIKTHIVTPITSFDKEELNR